LRSIAMRVAASMSWKKSLEVRRIGETRYISDQTTSEIAVRPARNAATQSFSSRFTPPTPPGDRHGRHDGGGGDQACDEREGEGAGGRGGGPRPPGRRERVVEHA